MASRLGVCANIFRVLFCIVNALITLLGVGAVAVGIYLLVVNDTLSFLTGNAIISGAAIILIAGVVTIVISALGFVGACLKWRPLLLIYVSVLVVIVILEFIAGILGFVFRDQVLNAASSQIIETVEDFMSRYRRAQDAPDFSMTVNTAVDAVQNLFMCCGSVQGPEDWNSVNPQFLLDNNNMLPRSCLCTEIGPNCMETQFQINNTGIVVNQTAFSQACANTTSTALRTLAFIGGGIGIAFGLLEVFGILVGIGLCCCITMAAKDKEVV